MFNIDVEDFIYKKFDKKQQEVKKLMCLLGMSIESLLYNCILKDRYDIAEMVQKKIPINKICLIEKALNYKRNDLVPKIMQILNVNPSIIVEKALFVGKKDFLERFIDCIGVKMGNLVNKALIERKYDIVQKLVLWFNLDQDPIIKKAVENGKTSIVKFVAFFGLSPEALVLKPVIAERPYLLGKVISFFNMNVYDVLDLAISKNNSILARTIFTINPLLNKSYVFHTKQSQDAVAADPNADFLLMASAARYLGIKLCYEILCSQEEGSNVYDPRSVSSSGSGIPVSAVNENNYRLGSAASNPLHAEQEVRSSLSGGLPDSSLPKKEKDNGKYASKLTLGREGAKVEIGRVG